MKCVSLNQFQRIDMSVSIDIDYSIDIDITFNFGGRNDMEFYCSYFCCIFTLKKQHSSIYCCYKMKIRIQITKYMFLKKM